MKSTSIVIRTKPGLHLRVAGQICEHARTLQSKITVRKGDRIADGRSIIDLLLLDAPEGTELELIAEGDDEEIALAAIKQVFFNGEGI